MGEATANPVSVVRKPRQGRQRAVEVLDPSAVERIRTWMLERGDLFSATLVQHPHVMAGGAGLHADVSGQLPNG